MQNFIRLFALCALLLSFISCTTYQYATVGSTLPANQLQEYVVENDTLQIRYSFWGQHGPVTLTIHNKLSRPLYIDWTRSALVLNDHSAPYWQNRSSLTATAETDHSPSSAGVYRSSSTIQGQIKTDEPTGFIAPNAYQTFSQFILDPEFADISSHEGVLAVKIKTASGTANAKQLTYGPENSPLKFRNYLTFATDPAFSEPISYDHQFWLADILQTHVSPELYLNESSERNRYHMSEASGAGFGLGLVGALLLVIALGAN